MISERTLKNWRKDALKEVERGRAFQGENVRVDNTPFYQAERILKLTQELLDLKLMNRC